MGGKVNTAFRVVKANSLGFLLVLLAGVLSPAAGADDGQIYSEYIIKKSLKEMPSYFYDMWAFLKTDEQTERYIRAFELVMEKVRADEANIVQFADGGDPIFDLKPGQPARMAVTGDSQTSPIYFNRGLTSDPNQFTYGNAITLWLHEFGHKIKIWYPDVTQDTIDLLADNIGNHFGKLAQIRNLPGLTGEVKLLTIDPLDGDMYERKNGTITELRDGLVYDRSAEFDAALDKMVADKNYKESRRILDIYAVEPGKFSFSFNNNRWPIKSEGAAGTDIGLGYFHSALIEWPSLNILSYQQTDGPQVVLRDGNIRFDLDTVKRDGEKLTGRIWFHLENRETYHMVEAKQINTDMIAMIDGVPRRVRVNVKFDLTNPLLYLKIEAAHEKTIEYSADCTVDLVGLTGHKVILQSLISRFHRYWMPDPPEMQFWQIRLDEPYAVQW